MDFCMCIVVVIVFLPPECKLFIINYFHHISYTDVSLSSLVLQSLEQWMLIQYLMALEKNTEFFNLFNVTLKAFSGAGRIFSG